MLLLTAILLAQTQIYCHLPNGSCFAWPTPLGITCPEEYRSFIPCPEATPTPTPTPIPPTATPTKTPTPIVQPTYSVAQFLKASDVGYTYIQAMRLIDGVLWGNGGVCCPGVGDGIGECLFSINYNVDPPAFREWWCTSRDTKDLWEVGSVQVTHSDQYKWVVAGQATRRPANEYLRVNDLNTPLIWGFGTQDLTSKPFTWGRNVSQSLVPSGDAWGRLWPQGIVDLGGQRWLYMQALPLSDYDLNHMYMQRWQWDSAHGTPYYDPRFNWPSGPSNYSVPFSGIAIDQDGSLLAASGWWPESGNKSVHIYRSTDEGRTWKDTGIRVDAPTGRTLFGCAWEHRVGGAATQPWHMVCTIGTGLGPDVWDWNAADVRFGTVKTPLSWGKKPSVSP